MAEHTHRYGNCTHKGKRAICIGELEPPKVKKPGSAKRRKGKKEHGQERSKCDEQ